MGYHGIRDSAARKGTGGGNAGSHAALGQGDLVRPVLGPGHLPSELCVKSFSVLETEVVVENEQILTPWRQLVDFLYICCIHLEKHCIQVNFFNTLLSFFNIISRTLISRKHIFNTGKTFC